MDLYAGKQLLGLTGYLNYKTKITTYYTWHANYHTEPLVKESQNLTIKDQYILNCSVLMHHLK